MAISQIIIVFFSAPLFAHISASQAALSSSDEQLGNGQNDCFPGLVYDRQYNACLCMNATLFGQGIVCQTNQAKLRQMPFCITSDWKDTDQVLGGVCPYQPLKNVTIPEWKVPQEGLNSLFCQPLNRNQTLCGKCAENYSLVINSYTFHCQPSIRCEDEGILILLLSAFGPLTIFYCLIFLLQVNVAVPYMFSYVLFAQTVSLCILHIQNGLLIAFNTIAIAETFTKILVSFNSVWILDVLTLFMPPICINRHINNIQAITLQYIIALYPLLMILLSYLMVELYDRNYRIVVWMFVPIKKCLLLLHIKIDPISSLLTTFATFFFLSFSRMTIISLMLLSHTNLLAPNGSTIRHVFLYDATMDYFGPEHLPYALLAIAITVFFLVLPLTIVFLYPTGLLHNGLRVLCSSQRAQILTTFMEVYMGHFKDGTGGSRDYRYFAGGQLLMRLTTFIFFFQTQEFTGLSYLTMLVFSVAWSLAILMLAPYKKANHNKLEGVMTLYMTIVFGITFYNLTLELLWQPSWYTEVTLYVALLLPGVVAVFLFCISIGRLCICPFLKSKLAFPRISIHSSIMSTVASENHNDSNSSENEQLIEAGADVIEYSSSDHIFGRDRFADEIGYGML